MRRDMQWREAVVRLLVAARPMTMAARVASRDSALQALAGWGSAMCQSGAYDAGTAGSDVAMRAGSARVDDARKTALEGVSTIALVGRRPMGVRLTGGNALARRPREIKTWRERWPDRPAARGARGANSR